MAEMHKCGQGWAYCDGNCTTCATNIPTYTSTSTDGNFHWLNRNADGKPIGGIGGKSERSGFITRIEPGKEEPYTVIFTTADLDKYRHIEDECRKMIGNTKEGRVMNDICQFVCSYRTPSGYCGSTGGYATCQHRKMDEPPTIKSADPIKPMTNADKIRQMSDEELAEWLVSHDKKCFLDGHLSKEGYMHWLEQEAKNDGT